MDSYWSCVVVVVVVVVAVVVFVRFNIKISEGTIQRRLLKRSSCGASIIKKI